MSESGKMHLRSMHVHRDTRYFDTSFIHARAFGTIVAPREAIHEDVCTADSAGMSTNRTSRLARRRKPFQEREIDP